MITYHPVSGAPMASPYHIASARPEYADVQRRICRENLTLIEQQKGQRLPHYRRGPRGYIRVS